MTSKLRSDAELRTIAIRFVETSRSAACTNSDQVSEVIKRNRFKIVKGVVFDVDEALQSIQRQLVLRAIKLAGPKVGHEKEIADLAWEHVWQSLAGPTPTTDVSVTATAFLNALATHTLAEFGYIAPNYAIRFKGQARRVVIGPVEAFVTQDLLQDLVKGPPGSPWNVSVGDEFSLQFPPTGLNIQFAPVSWRIKVNSALGFVSEEATWLVNVALSLLRFSYPLNPVDFFPSIGDREAMPLSKPEADRQGLTVTANGISIGGQYPPGFYIVDDSIISVTSDIEFQSRSKAIFEPTKGSLGERFGQGLGWLTRGRQTADRAERFLLFFTAIEALLSSDDKTSPVVQTIARHAAVILEEDVRKRAKLAGDIKALYATRSALVHAGRRNVSRPEANSAQLIAEALFEKVMKDIALTTSLSHFHETLSEASYGLPWPPSSSHS